MGKVSLAFRPLRGLNKDVSRPVFKWKKVCATAKIEKSLYRAAATAMIQTPTLQLRKGHDAAFLFLTHNPSPYMTAVGENDFGAMSTNVLINLRRHQWR
jgi:hypothetical protein